MHVERQESRAAIRAAAAEVRRTCGYVAVPTMVAEGGPSVSNTKARAFFSKVAGVILFLLVLAVLMLAGCAFTPEGLQSAGESMQTVGGVVRDVAGYTPIGGLGGLVEGLGTLAIAAAGYWKLMRKAPVSVK